MQWKCIQFITKGNLFLMKNLLESWRTKYINTWAEYQKMWILIN